MLRPISKEDGQEAPRLMSSPVSGKFEHITGPVLGFYNVLVSVRNEVGQLLKEKHYGE